MAETNDNGGCRRSVRGAAAGGSGGDVPPKRTSRMINELSDTNNKSKVTWTPTNEKRKSKSVVLFGQQQSSPSSPLSEQETTTSVARQLDITDDRYLNKRVAKFISDIPFFGTVIAVHPDKNNKRRKVYEIRYDNIRDTEEEYTSAVREMRTTYNDPEVANLDKTNHRRVGDEEQPDQSPKEKRGGDRTKTTARKSNNAKRSVRTVGQRQANKKQKVAAAADRPQQPKLVDEDGITIVTHGNYEQIAGKSPYAYKVISNDPALKDIKYKPMKKLNKHTQWAARFTCKDRFAFNDGDVDEEFYSSDDDDEAFFDEENGEPRPTVDLIGGLMLPDSLIDEIVHRTNRYSEWRLRQPEWIIDPVTKEETKNNQWLHKDRRMILDRSDILFFFAIYYYMGVVQLPAKADYWARSADGIDPVHWMNQVYPMYRFNFVWRNISLDPQFASESYRFAGDATDRDKDDASTVASDATGYSEGDNDLNDHYLSSDDESDVDDDDDDSTAEEVSKKASKDWKQITKKDHKSDKKWYNKAALLLDWLNCFSRNHCKHLVRFCFWLFFSFAFSAAD